MDYAVIRVGNKQHRVRDGETLVVDRVRADEGGTFEPDVLLGDDGVKIVATVVAHGRGPKIRIGKYRRRTGYKRHNGFRAATSQIEISFGGSQRKAAKPKPAKVEAEPVAETAAEGLPEGYADLKVADVAKAAKTWDREQLEAALAYEQAHAARKGAVAALESALAASEAADRPEPSEEPPAEEPTATAEDAAVEEPEASEEEPAAAVEDVPAEDEPDAEPEQKEEQNGA
jgi:large subunit ribosomal protein L21